MFNKLKRFLDLLHWHRFPETAPPKEGWYMTTVEVPRQQRYTMSLYWYPDRHKFIDNIRQDTFNTYEVFGWSNDVGEDGKFRKVRMFTSDLCDRTEDVVAWRSIPKAYMKGFIDESWHPTTM